MYFGPNIMVQGTLMFSIVCHLNIRWNREGLKWPDPQVPFLTLFPQIKSPSQKSSSSRPGTVAPYSWKASFSSLSAYRIIQTSVISSWGNQGHPILLILKGLSPTPVGYLLCPWTQPSCSCMVCGVLLL